MDEATRWRNIAEKRKQHIEKLTAKIRELKQRLNKYPDLWRLECGHFAQVSTWNVPGYKCGHCAALAEVERLKQGENP